MRGWLEATMLTWITDHLPVRVGYQISLEQPEAAAATSRALEDRPALVPVEEDAWRVVDWTAGDDSGGVPI